MSLHIDIVGQTGQCLVVEGTGDDAYLATIVTNGVSGKDYLIGYQHDGVVRQTVVCVET